MTHEDQVDHQPVLPEEVLAGLSVQSGRHYVDCTLGGAGHARLILEASAPRGRLLGLDSDSEAIDRCRRRLAPHQQRLTLVQANFSSLAETARAYGFGRVHGVLFDLGLSSFQLAARERGFSFQLDGPLDMRFDRRQGRTAADLLNGLSESELADLFWRYGEERYSRRIARHVVQNRPLRTTSELAEAVAQCVGRRGRLHPATKAFMALRVATNKELVVLEAALPQAMRLLVPGQGRLAVLSYHSLEDRVVKHWLRREAHDCICPPRVPQCLCDHRAGLRILTSRPLRPSPDEIADNPRSRSARLRLAERLPQTRTSARLEEA